MTSALGPGSPWIAASSTKCYISALFAPYSNQLQTIFTLTYLALHSPTSIFTSSTWILHPVWWGITILRRIKKHTLRKNYHSHSRRRPIIIASWKFQLPTEQSLPALFWRCPMSVLQFIWSRVLMRLIAQSVITNVNTLESPLCLPISKKIIWTTNRRFYILARCTTIRYYKLQGIHYQRLRAMPILSVYALHFQICEIWLGPLHHHCANTRTQLSTYSSSLT